MADDPDRRRAVGQSLNLLAAGEGREGPAKTPEDTVVSAPAIGQDTAAPEAGGLARIGTPGEPLDPPLATDDGEAGERAWQPPGRSDELTRIEARLDALESNLGLVRNLAMQVHEGERAWVDDRIRRTGRDLGIGLMVMVVLALILFAVNWWRTDRRFDLIAAHIAKLDQRAAAASAALPAPAAAAAGAAQGGNATSAPGAADKRSTTANPPPARH